MYKILALTSLIALAQARGDDSTVVAGALGGDQATGIGGAPAPEPAPFADDPPTVVPTATTVDGNLGDDPLLISTDTTEAERLAAEEAARMQAQQQVPAPTPAPVVPNTATIAPVGRAPIAAPTSQPAAGMPSAPPTLPPASAVAPDNQASNGDVYDANKHDIAIDYGNKKIVHHDIADHLDEHTQPMCAIGGKQSHQDDEKPTDYCCRIYEMRNFYGRYFDVCYNLDLASGNPDTFDLPKYGWHEEVSSWKCGAKVEMIMCDEPLTKVGKNSCPVSKSESGGRNSSNAKTHFDNKIDFIRLYIAKTKFSATIYEEKGCQGRSQLLKGGDLRQGSWNSYKGTPGHSALLTAGTVNSVFLDELTDISFYNHNHFMNDQWTVRNHSMTDAECIDLDPSPFGAPIGLYNNLHSAWVHKNWFPNGDFVPNDTWKITT